MPKREDETYLNIVGHPPACTCADCVNRRLHKTGGRRQRIINWILIGAGVGLVLSSFALWGLVPSPPVIGATIMIIIGAVGMRKKK